MNCRIEPLLPTAAIPASLLHRACFPDDPWDAGAIEQVMGMPGFFGRIAWADQIPVGFALALDLGRECEVIALGVVCGHRRAGIGSALLDSVYFEAGRRRADCVVLEVAADNHAARRLYAVRGFTIVGRRRDYYRHAGSSVDALILRAALAAGRTAT